jgi:IS30 family transposase
LTDEHIDAEERHAIASKRSQHIKVAKIARCLGRHRSTIYRELKRNASAPDGNDRAATPARRQAERCGSSGGKLGSNGVNAMPPTTAVATSQARK